MNNELGSLLAFRHVQIASVALESEGEVKRTHVQFLQKFALIFSNLIQEITNEEGFQISASNLRNQ